MLRLFHNNLTEQVTLHENRRLRSATNSLKVFKDEKHVYESF